MADEPRDGITIVELPDGRRRVRVGSVRWDTTYPRSLVDAIIATKGPATVDEIRRDEDERYVAQHLRLELLAFLDDASFVERRLLDFGCGAGASTMCLARLLPSTSIVGLDYQRALIELAELRRRYYAFAAVRFACSPAPDVLPADLGDFDFVVLSAVYEHLLPDERAPLLGRLWRLVRPGGVLFLNQTPHRYWPIEAHTTRLPLLNYLPDPLALLTARAFCARVLPEQTWNELLRRGIRGGTAREIMRHVASSGAGRPELLEPVRFGLRDRIDLWYLVSTRARTHRLKPPLRRVLKTLRRVTGVTLVPHLALAIRKAA
jgi:2-polyprenyl-3-methyl-5-hydroxy-6-metoxy-1,4-benzoquinol methylase